MARRATSLADLNCSPGQVQLVVDYHELFGPAGLLAEPLSNGIAAQVHEGLRLDEEDLFFTQFKTTVQRVRPLALQADSVALGQPVSNGETHVMRRELVLRSRIPEPDQ